MYFCENNPVQTGFGPVRPVSKRKPDRTGPNRLSQTGQTGLKPDNKPDSNRTDWTRSDAHSTRRSASPLERWYARFYGRWFDGTPIDPVDPPRMPSDPYGRALHWLTEWDFVAIIVARAQRSARHSAIDRVYRETETLPLPAFAKRRIRRQAVAVLVGLAGDSLYPASQGTEHGSCLESTEHDGCFQAPKFHG